MKNPTEAQLAALAARARALSRRLPPLERGEDGCLTPESHARFAALCGTVLRRNRAVGACLVLLTPEGAADVFCHGMARLKPALPVTPRTCFRVASVSKLVLSFGTLSLAQDGLLGLDEDVSRFLGYLVRNPHAPDVPVTLRMLLTHTASLRDEGNYGTRGMQPDCTLRELLSDPANWMSRPPGQDFHYTNLGAGAAGVVMERAAGRPLDDIMRERVFLPLAIRASYDPRRILPHADLADGYSVRAFFPPRLQYDAAALAARPPAPFDPERDYLCAAGRMATDAPGMAALLRLLASHGEKGVLSGASLEEMRANQSGRCGIAHAGRGLNTAFLPGVFRGASPVGHQGVAYGMCAELFADPHTGAGVGVMINGALLTRVPPLMRVGFDLLALGFAALC